MLDYYKILGISTSASSAEIKRAYRRKAMVWHPDKSTDPAAKQIFQELSEAYYVLGNEQSRKRYDFSIQYGASVLREEAPAQSSRDRRRAQRQGSRKSSAKPPPRPKEPDYDFSNLERVLFLSLLFIGILAIFLSIRDLIVEEWIGINSLTGIVFSLGFTFLLVFMYFTFYYRRGSRKK